VPLNVELHVAHPAKSVKMDNVFRVEKEPFVVAHAVNRTKFVPPKDVLVTEQFVVTFAVVAIPSAAMDIVSHNVL